MESLTIILFLIGCIGALVATILIIKNAIKKQDNKMNKNINRIHCVINNSIYCSSYQV